MLVPSMVAVISALPACLAVTRPFSTSTAPLSLVQVTVLPEFSGSTVAVSWQFSLMTRSTAC